MTSLSVVLSFRNEEAVLPELMRRLHATLEPMGMDYEFIFVNDASTDRSLDILKEQSKKDFHIRILNMSRRFGVGPCMLAGLRHAAGSAVVTMDTDLQDPPEIIPQMVEAWLKGAEVVHTVRTAREGESRFKIWLTRMAYGFLHLVSDIHLPREAGDFKLISRRLADELLRFNEKDPYLRGMISWLGFKQAFVPYRRQKRFAGITHFPLHSRGPLRTFLSALTSFSAFPLKMLILFGLAAMVFSWGYLILPCLMKCAGLEFHEWSPVLAAVLFFGACQLLSAGVLGLYMSRIYAQVNNRPDYVIESRVGFEMVQR